MAKREGLTPKQARFVDEYSIDSNATQAAIRAGYSQKTAQVIGSENLSKPLVAAAIQARQQSHAEKAEFTVEAHMAELESLRNLAKAAGQHGAAIAAETKRGEVAGFYVKRREDVTRLSASERADRIKRVLKIA